MAARKQDSQEKVAKKLGMTPEQLAHVEQQAAAARARGRRPAGTAGAETKLASWGDVDGQDALFPSPATNGN
ncbi:hypothetical protein [Amycolatopsis sp. H20-H5]|uniref:hypothetical protein n=1 Tax=Amycolatopsis sp. H20-H5 TaxID=3046309 RepID=UPI002DBFFCEF|nr:hypothetical protein [Amycolatopsis sp. H20-H5]MEC3976247.1 hypothetical protein [Amycolatopsis sp. H20-H5]